MGISKAKYSSQGLVQASALKGSVIEKATAESLAKLLNFGLFSRTWDTYSTTINNIMRCQ